MTAIATTRLHANANTALLAAQAMPPGVDTMITIHRPPDRVADLYPTALPRRVRSNSRKTL